MLRAVRWIAGAAAIGVPVVLGSSNAAYVHAEWQRQPETAAVFAALPLSQPFSTPPSPAPEASRQSLAAEPSPAAAPARGTGSPASHTNPPVAAASPGTAASSQGPSAPPPSTPIPSPLPEASPDPSAGSTAVPSDSDQGTPEPGASPTPSGDPGSATDPGSNSSPTPDSSSAPPPAASPTPPATPPSQNNTVQPPAPPPSPKPRSFDQLAADINSVSGGASVGVTLIELGGNSPTSWSSNGDDQFTAASTYKLPLLIAEADGIATGKVGANDVLCYQDGDWEDGPFGDYTGGACYSRIDLMSRVGQFSDNTAAHILVRYLGGADALNAYAQAHGARESAFFDPNVTTSSDLARLWASEAAGQAGGKGAQQILYPILTHTHWESGAPAGVPDSATVVHKVGMIGAVDNDAALVIGGPQGNYVLVVCTDGIGGDAGWALIAAINAKVWVYEASRQ